MSVDFQNYFKNHKDEILNNIKELIAIPSVLVEQPEIKDAPFGFDNVKALEYMLELGRKNGFKTYNCDNVCGHIEYGEGEEVFACLCHTDVVPAIGNWTRPPFESYIKDGKIYGRGSIDDKGPAIISFYALKALKDMNVKLNKKVRLIIGTDEESGSRCVKHYIEKVGMPDMGISPDAEFPIIYGEKGMITLDVLYNGKSDLILNGGARYNIVAPNLEIKALNNLDKYKNEIDQLKEAEIKDDIIYVKGVSAHAMEPENGKNAIVIFSKAVNNVTDNKLIKFIAQCLGDSRLKAMKLDYHSEEMNDMTMNVGLINTEVDEQGNTKITLGLNIRYPKGFDYDTFIEEFNKQANSYGLNVIVKSHSKPHYVDPNSEFIRKLHQSYKKFTNDDTPLKTIGGGTYARELKLAVAYGVLFPNEEELAHQTDEYADIENLLKAGEIILDAIYNICK